MLRHAVSRAQEELEKIQAVEFPARALLHRLCRTDVPAVRANLASHYLTPQREGIQLPDGRVLPPPEGTSGGLKPLVDPAEFAAAMGVAVEQLRALDVDGAAVTEAVDDIRTVAKEARLALVQAHGGEEAPEVIEFQHAQPVFQPGAAAALRPTLSSSPEDTRASARRERARGPADAAAGLSRTRAGRRPPPFVPPGVGGFGVGTRRVAAHVESAPFRHSVPRWSSPTFKVSTKGRRA